MIKNYLTSLKQEFSGYNTAKLMKDIMAGLTVCAVALPPCAGVRRIFRRYGSCGSCYGDYCGRCHCGTRRRLFQISGPQAR